MTKNYPLCKETKESILKRLAKCRSLDHMKEVLDMYQLIFDTPEEEFSF